MPAVFPRVRSEETGLRAARPRAPRLVRERSDTAAARAGGASEGEAGMRERDGDRFRPRIDPRGQATVRSLRATAHSSFPPFCGMPWCCRQLGGRR